jgi:hypothetical protein
MRKRNAFATGFYAGIPYAVVALLISIKIHYFILVWLFSVVFQILGALYGASYIRKGHMNEDWLKVLFWSNLVTWIFPPLGLFGAGCTRVINYRNQGGDRNLYMKLAAFCFIASIINATVLFNILFVAK